MFDKIKKLGTHVLIYGIGHAGTGFVGFLLIPVYSRYLTPEDYGVLALVSMFGQLLYTLMNMGQSGALFRTYLLHEDPGGRDAVIATSLWLILMLSFPIGLLGVVLAQPLSRLLIGSPAYTTWVILGIAGVTFKTLLRLPLAVLRAKEKSRSYTTATFAQTVASLVLAILFVVGLHLGGRGVLLSQLLAEIIICLYLVPQMLRGLTMRFSKQDARSLLGYGLAVTPAPILSFFIHLSDRYILRHFVSVGAVGIYALGYRFGEILYFALMAMELAYAPFIYANLKSPDAPRLYGRVTTYYFGTMGLLWLVVSLFAEETVKIMAHPAFHDAYLVVPWIAGAFLFQGVGWVASIGLYVRNIVAKRLGISAAAAALNIGLNLWLIPRYGMMGAAWAALLSQAAKCALQIGIGAMVFRVDYEWGRVIKLTVVGAGVFALGGMISWGSLFVALVGKGLLVASAPLLLYLIGFFEHGEAARVKSVIANLRKGRLGPLGASGAGE